ncbi:MAG: pyrroline-5-carboxylate reductase [Clostridia bacterium]|nr:proC 1 [Clostridiales bacterium]MDK2985204.1 pyrroline-5-carboxylate reductase [Clostridia bacterium]
MLDDKKLCIIGSGYMAEAIIKGLVSKNLLPAENIFVVNPLDEEKVLKLKDLYGIIPREKEAGIIDADIIIIAFKPQDVAEAMAMYNPFFRKDHLLISILAGISTDLLQKLADSPLAIVRTMPNLALGIGESATAYCLGKYANEKHAQTVEKIFSTTGSIIRVQEKDMDIVTGLSGSGPAYIYYLLEALIEGGCKEGLSEEKAMELAKQTLIGAAKLLQESGAHPKELRRKITSAKGTTEAAINKMDSYQFTKIVQEGVSAATRRSKQLGKIFEENAIHVVNM